MYPRPPGIFFIRDDCTPALPLSTWPWALAGSSRFARHSAPHCSAPPHHSAPLTAQHPRVAAGEPHLHLHHVDGVPAALDLLGAVPSLLDEDHASKTMVQVPEVDRRDTTFKIPAGSRPTSCLNVKPIKLQITAPGPGGGALAQRRLDVRPGLQALPMGAPRVVRGWVLRVCWAGERVLRPLGPGSGSQKEHRARSPELTELELPPTLALRPLPSWLNATRLHITLRRRVH